MKIPTINFGRHVKTVEHFITDNSPTILTALGVVGVGATAILTHRAATAGKDVIEAEWEDRNSDPAVPVRPDFTKAEKFSLTWKLYIAPMGAGVLTCACIIGANRISAKRAAALAGVLAMTQENFKDYKEKVKEKISGPAAKKVDGELAQETADKVFARHDPDDFDLKDGDVICIEKFSGRPFSSNREKLQRAENEINKRILNASDGASPMSDFYELIGLEDTGVSQEFGWNQLHMLELDYVPVFTNKGQGKPAMLVDYLVNPVHRPWQSGTFQDR